MASTLNASTAAGGGLISTADASGILQLQTAGTTAVTVDASQNVSTVNTINVPNTFGFKNRIINGAMMIDQRNAGASVTLDGVESFPVDRFPCGDVTSGAFTAQRVSDGPTGFINSIKCTITSAAGSFSATDSAYCKHSIEGLNIADLAWGTLNAAPITLSFWVKSSLTGTFGGALRNNDATRSYPYSYTINAANTWEQKVITIAGDTTGTWLTTNGVGINIQFSLGAGSSRTGTAGAWNSNNNVGATGQVQVISTLGATWQITGVQLEKGSTATSFDYRPYGTELALCRRYLPAKSSQGGTNAPIGIAVAPNSTGLYLQWTFDVPARVAPTGVVVSSASHFTANAYGTGGGVASAVNFSSASNTDAAIQFVTTGLTAGQSGNIIANNASANIYLTGCEL